MEIREEHFGPMMVAAFDGEMVMDQITGFLADNDDLLDQGIRAVVLDLAGVDFIGSTALSMVIALQRRLAEANIGLTLCSPSKPVAQVLEVTRLNRTFKIYPDRASAMAELGGV